MLVLLGLVRARNGAWDVPPRLRRAKIPRGGTLRKPFAKKELGRMAEVNGFFIRENRGLEPLGNPSLA